MSVHQRAVRDMAEPLVHVNVRVVERRDRAVVAMAGLPARPVLLPMALVDLEPRGLDSETFLASMTRQVAKDLGLLI